MITRGGATSIIPVKKNIFQIKRWCYKCHSSDNKIFLKQKRWLEGREKIITPYISLFLEHSCQIGNTTMFQVKYLSSVVQRMTCNQGSSKMIFIAIT
jgi:hypothetical protein